MIWVHPPTSNTVCPPQMNQVGVHGIIIAFKCPGGSGRRYSATYLPEVAREQRESCLGAWGRVFRLTRPLVHYLQHTTPNQQGWSKEEALESLVRKAGYNVRPAPTSHAPNRLTGCPERLTPTPRNHPIPPHTHPTRAS